MSPEQLSADRDPTQASDLYSLGCVLYEMLLGEPPFTGATAQAVFAKVLTEEPTHPTGQRKTIPRNVGAAVRRALEKIPADRFRTAKDFARALDDPVFFSVLLLGIAAAIALLLGTMGIYGVLSSMVSRRTREMGFAWPWGRRPPWFSGRWWVRAWLWQGWASWWDCWAPGH